jgi:hypothetical protein
MRFVAAAFLFFLTFAAAAWAVGLAALLEPICADQEKVSLRCAQPTIWLAIAAIAFISSVVILLKRDKAARGK